MKILHLVNIDQHFAQHLIPATRAQVAAGHEVHAAGARTDAAAIEKIRAAGITWHDLPFHRSSLNPMQMLAEWRATARLVRQLQPALIRTSTWKPLAAIGMARRHLPPLRVHYAIPGLGYMFLNRSAKAQLARRSTLWLLTRIARVPNTRFEVLNSDDQRWLASLIGDAAPIDLLPGLGVDTEYFAPLPQPPAPPYIFVLPARLLWDKGIRELVEAARLLHAERAPVRVVLAGPLDPGNPRAISEAQLQQWQQEGILDYWGNLADIRTGWVKAHGCILPSYREGLSMTLIEAAACARAIICSDVSGCRETVGNGESGFLVPVGDAGAIAAAIMRYVANPALLTAHGEAGRRHALAQFDVRIVQKIFLEKAEQA